MEASLRLSWTQGFASVIAPMALALAILYLVAFPNTPPGTINYIGVACALFSVLFGITYRIRKVEIGGQQWIGTVITTLTISSAALLANAAMQFGPGASGATSNLHDRILFFLGWTAVVIATVVNAYILIARAAPLWSWPLALDCLIPWGACVHQYWLGLRHVYCAMALVTPVTADWSWPFYIVNTIVVIALLTHLVRSRTSRLAFAGLTTIVCTIVFFGSREFYNIIYYTMSRCY